MIVLLVAAIGAGIAVSSAVGAPFFLLHSTTAEPGDRARVELPDARASCPVTRPNHVVPPSGRRGYPILSYGNGLLSVYVSSDGGMLTQRRDGRFFQKIGWTARRGFTGRLSVRGERLDAPSLRIRVLGVHWGHNSVGQGGWASAVEFPSEGCWRITGRVRDISLSYVVRVVGV